MDVKVERIAGGSRVTMNYRAAGFAKGGAAEWRPWSTRYWRSDEAVTGFLPRRAQAGHAQALTSVTVRQAGVSAVGIWSS